MIIPSREDINAQVHDDIARVFDSQYADGEQGRMIRFIMVEQLDKLWDAIREIQKGKR